MTFLGITVVVMAVLAYSYLKLRDAYGKPTLLKLVGLTLVFFFVKELLQAHKLLVHHYYHVNHAIWIELLGVPPFIVFGHLFVVVMTWQLAVMTLHRLKLSDHPAVFVALIWFFTAGFAMLMENTGIVGHWWTWAMPSWWSYPSLLGAPLVDLPLERPITSAWGYFISTYWFMLLLTDLPRRWTMIRGLVLVVGLAMCLALSRITATNNWGPMLIVLSILSVMLSRHGEALRRWLPFPSSSALLQQPRPGQGRVVAVGLTAMFAVCIAQMVVKSKWLALVSLFPLVAFALGTWRRWPVWASCALSAGAMVVGYLEHSGNVMLAGWLVFRCGAVLWVLILVMRWRDTRRQALRAITTQEA